MERKVEGTYSVDGMIEGPISKLPDFKERIEAWVDFAKSRGLDFEPEFQSDKFSMIALHKTSETKILGKHPADHVLETLDKLIKIFPADSRNQLLSTVRFSEYLPQKEKQSVFAVNPGGEFEILEREIDIDTVPPPVPLSKKDLIRFSLVSTVILLSTLFVTSFFIDYKELVMGLLGHETRFHSDSIKIDTGIYNKFITVKNMGSSDKGRAIIVEITKTPLFPSNMQKLDNLLKPSNSKLLFNKLAISTLIKGYLRIEFFHDGVFINTSEIRIKDLFKKEKISVKIQFPEDTITTRLQFVL